VKTAIVPVGDAISALMALLTPAEQASVAGGILHNVGIDDATVQAFLDELVAEELSELAHALDDSE
jgi:hypothetical protein